MSPTLRRIARRSIASPPPGARARTISSSAPGTSTASSGAMGSGASLGASSSSTGARQRRPLRGLGPLPTSSPGDATGRTPSTTLDATRALALRHRRGSGKEGEAGGRLTASLRPLVLFHVLTGHACRVRDQTGRNLTRVHSSLTSSNVTSSGMSTAMSSGSHSTTFEIMRTPSSSWTIA